MIDLTGTITEDQVPLCPVCEQPIFKYEPAILGYLELKELLEIHK